MDERRTEQREFLTFLTRVSNEFLRRRFLRIDELKEEEGLYRDARSRRFPLMMNIYLQRQVFQECDELRGDR